MQVSIIIMYKSTCSSDKKNKIIERITKENNGFYLVKGYGNPEFPYLGEVEVDDPSTFDSDDMVGIIEELQRVRKDVVDSADQAHIDDIIRLAQQCKEDPETVLVFV